MNKPIRMIFLSIGLLLLSISSMAADKISMGYFNLIPHVFHDKATNQVRGAAVDYFNAVAFEMGYEIDWSGPLPFPRLINYLKEGEVDGSLMMNKNPGRQQFLYFPQTPYHMVHRIFVVRKENPLDRITSIDDTAGYRVGFMEEAHLSPFIRNNRDKLTLELIGGEDWIWQNLLKLIAGRLDAVYDLNAETMLYQAKKLEIDHRIKVLRLPDPPGGVYIVFSKKSKNGRHLLDRYEQVVRIFKPAYADYLKPYMQ